MMQIEWFDMDGHITDEGFAKLMSGEADELSRLELSEHLDFCDRCVDRYSEYLTTAALCDPCEDLTPKVLTRIRRRTKELFRKRATKVGLAAGLTILVWFGGIFRGNAIETTDVLTRKMLEREPAFGIAMQDFGVNVQQFFQNFHLFFERGTHQ